MIALYCTIYSNQKVNVDEKYHGSIFVMVTQELTFMYIFKVSHEMSMIKSNSCEKVLLGFLLIYKVTIGKIRH